jgi:hypothetical protein
MNSDPPIMGNLGGGWEFAFAGHHRAAGDWNAMCRTMVISGYPWGGERGCGRIWKRVVEYTARGVPHSRARLEIRDGRRIKCFISLVERGLCRMLLPRNGKCLSAIRIRAGLIKAGAHIPEG